ncbi:MAG: bifunctional tetrahydrofolate synthase/dihydrofolate synthase [Gammaproteobacteria bacterium]|nr:bifunctional tetrahydrofolate synthase/dihydrofolate synthase [Gammaproteobacteria bacterium]
MNPQPPPSEGAATAFAPPPMATGMGMAQWLDYIESIERGRGIRLGLERISRAWRQVGSPRPARTIVTVAGTNGKGSVVHLLTDALRAHGIRAGRYTSPHLRLFNERIAVDGRLASDEECVQAFERVYASSAGAGLSYFEYITLSALIIMEAHHLDVAVLEVGLGGRYDAVNLIDADLAIITSVGKDHCEYLGHDVRGIAREKCGIMRPLKPVLCAIEPVGAAGEIVKLIEQQSAACGARLQVAGQDWRWQIPSEGRWIYRSGGLELDLAVPSCCGETGLDNAAVVVQALGHLLPSRVDGATLNQVFTDHQLDGRYQFDAHCPHILYDTAHNVPAVERLLCRIQAQGNQVNSILLNVRHEKDLDGIAALFTDPVSAWLCVDFGDQLYTATELSRRLSALMDTGRLPLSPLVQPPNPDVAAEMMRDLPNRANAVNLICGSFIVLDKMMSALEPSRSPAFVEYTDK